MQLLADKKKSATPPHHLFVSGVSKDSAGSDLEQEIGQLQISASWY